MSNIELFVEPEYVLLSCKLRIIQDKEDIREIANVLSQMDPWKTLGYSSYILVEYLLRYDPALRRYTVIRDSRIVGMLCIRNPWLLGPCIELIGIKIHYQGLGIGQDILKWIESHTISKSRNIWVLVSSFNNGAFKFYSKAGFSEIARVADLTSVEYEEILMRKVIS